MSRKQRIIVLIAAVLLIALVLFTTLVPAVVEDRRNAVLPHDPYPVSDAAQRLHASLLIGDWHTDSLLWDRDLLKRGTRGHVDFPRLNEGNVGLQMLTAVTKSPKGHNYDRNAADASDNITPLVMAQRWPMATWTSLLARALHQASRLRGYEKRAPATLTLVRTQSDLANVLKRRAAGDKVIGVLLGIEGGHPLEGKIGNVDVLYEAGYRLIGLTHFFDNELGGSLHGESNAGLTDFGREVVAAAMQRGIILDLAHASPQVAEDVLALDKRPLVVSHTGVRGHCDHKRNFPDALMKKIASQGGVIAIGYWKTVVCDPSPKGVVAAIAAAVKLVGEDHVSLGSDYDGSVTVAFDTAELAALTHEMLAAGFSETRIRKIAGGNMARVLEQVLPK